MSWKVGDKVVVVADTGSRIPPQVVGKIGLIEQLPDPNHDDRLSIYIDGYGEMINGVWFLKSEDIRHLTKLEKAMK